MMQFDQDERRIRAALETLRPAPADLWPAVAAKLPAARPPRRMRRRALALAAGLALLCPLGVGAARHWIVYDRGGSRVVLNEGEAFVPGDGSAAFAAGQETPPDPSEIEWGYDWPDRADTPLGPSCPAEMNAFALTAQPGQLFLYRQSLSGSAGTGGDWIVDGTPGSAEELAAAMEVSPLPFRLPAAVPARYSERPRFGVSYYLAPGQTGSLLPAGSHSGEEEGLGWYAQLYDLPEEVLQQIEGYSMTWYQPDKKYISVSAGLCGDDELYISGDESLTVQPLRLPGFEKGQYAASWNSCYQTFEVRVHLWQAIPPVEGYLHGLDRFAALPRTGDSTLDVVYGGEDATPETWRYIHYTITAFGASEEELNDLLASLE